MQVVLQRLHLSTRRELDQLVIEYPDRALGVMYHHDRIINPWGCLDILLHRNGGIVLAWQEARVKKLKRDKSTLNSPTRKLYHSPEANPYPNLNPNQSVENLGSQMCTFLDKQD